MKEGWDATGLLLPLWTPLGGRDALAEKAGITPAGTLSAYNSGKRPLGRKNGEKLAVALGVTIFDLGAPASQAESQEELSILARQEELAATLAEAMDEIVVLQTRVKTLEDQQAPGQAAPTQAERR